MTGWGGWLVAKGLLRGCSEGVVAAPDEGVRWLAAVTVMFSCEELGLGLRLGLGLGSGLGSGLGLGIGLDGDALLRRLLHDRRRLRRRLLLLGLG